MTGFIELTTSTEGKFITKKEDVDIAFYDSEAEATVAVINGVPTVLSETYEEIRDLLL